MIKQILSIILLGALLPSAYAAKPMSNDEIKKMIVQGSLRDYDLRDRRDCPADFRYKEIKNDLKPDAISKQRTQEYQYGRNWGIKEIQSETKTYESNIPAPKILCICPCPYSRDPSGKECGDYSAYFQFPDEDKPKCYPEDVKDYEVNDFRSDNGIPQAVEKAPAERR